MLIAALMEPVKGGIFMMRNGQISAQDEGGWSHNTVFYWTGIPVSTGTTWSPTGWNLGHSGWFPGWFRLSSNPNWQEDPVWVLWSDVPTLERNAFTQSYPVLGPFYSIWTVNPAWLDAWSMHPYQGMW